MFRPLSLLLLATALLSACSSAPAPRPGAVSYPVYAVNPLGTPAVRSASYLLIDAASGQPLAGSAPDSLRAVASTQKLLMALVVLDAGNLDKRVTITAADKAVRSDGVKVAALRVGDSCTRRQLLTACLVKSANDMVQALARDVGGSQERFVAMMNAKARSLGMRHSWFVNPHGMPGPQHSTARDMAIAARAAYYSPVVRGAVCRQDYAFITGAGRTIRVETTNKLLKRMPECNGLKTGYTSAAGPCLISSASRRGRTVILVQLGSAKGDARWDDARTMLDWGLRRLGG